jgi:ferredoxin
MTEDAGGHVEPIALYLNKQTCAATRTCVNLAPHLFRYDPDKGHSEVVSDVVEDPDQILLAREAAESCPTASITTLSE